jgi:SAM-dependent methyltransferase
MACRACGSIDLTTLPDPHPAQAVVSDGRIVPYALGKVSCRGCGLVSTPARAEATDARSHYDSAYDLNLVDSPAEQARARRYAGLIGHLFGDRVPGRVLEIGCGSGALLRALAADWPATRFEGIEAAPALAALPSGDARIAKRRGFAEDLRPGGSGYDLVYSINVVEHASDPVVFLRALAAQTAAGGAIVIVCPSGATPNLELVFADHLHSFTADAFRLLAAQAGLEVAQHRDRPEGLGDFQVFLLAKSQGGTSPGTPAGEALSAARGRYLTAWSELDRHVDTRLGPDHAVAVFGAGEATCLLRAYAPRTWRRVEQVWVDDPAAARRFDRPVVAYAGIPPSRSRRVLIATHPASQVAVAARLERDGHSVAIWSDLIAR